MIDNIVVFNKIAFSYGRKEVFNNLTLKIKKGTWVSIVGANGSGKSTIIKLLTGLIMPSSGYIKVDKIRIQKDNLIDIRKKIGVVLENPINQFVSETVGEDISFAVCNLKMKRKDIVEKVYDIAKILDIEDFLEKSPDELSGGERQKIALAGVLIYEPEIIILDESLSMLDQNDRKEVLLLLKRLQTEKGLTIICVTHDMEETLFADEIIVINNGKVAVHDDKYEVYKKDNLLNEVGLKLPFMVDMSYKFMYYKMLNEVVLTPKELVDKLWK